MSKSRLISYSNKFPTLAEWSKGFRHRNSTAPRSTIGNPSIAGNLYNFFFFNTLSFKKNLLYSYSSRFSTIESWKCREYDGGGNISRYVNVTRIEKS